MRRADAKLMNMAPGMTTIAVSASRQFRVSSTPIAMTRRMTARAGDTIAICKRPVVVSTSPVRPEPAQVIAEVLAAFGPPLGGVGLALVRVEPALLVVADEGQVALARGARMLEAFRAVVHDVAPR